MKKIHLACGVIASTLAIAGTSSADSVVNSIITSAATGSSNKASQSCDPDGRQSVASEEECLDSYCSQTSLPCAPNPELPPKDEEVETALHDAFDDYGNRVRLIDRRAFVELRVVTRSNLRFSLFSTKDTNVYLARAVNGIQIDLLLNGINIPRNTFDGDVLLIDEAFMAKKLGSLLAQIRPNDAMQISDICRYVSNDEHVANIIDAALASIRNQSNFEAQYYYWKDRPRIAVNNLSNIGRSCWLLAKKYS
jgi:hypothetical protein